MATMLVFRVKHVPILLSLLFSHLIPATFAAVRTFTMDDTTGDTITKPTYLPSPNAWTSNGSIKPDVIRASGGTWHAATYQSGSNPVSFEFEFAGRQVHVYFILPPRLSGTPVNLAYNVILDGKLDTTFNYNPTDPNAYTYNFLGYSKTGLDHIWHTLRFETGGDSAYVAFDYATWVWDDADGPIFPPPSFSSPTTSGGQAVTTSPQNGTPTTSSSTPTSAATSATPPTGTTSPNTFTSTRSYGQSTPGVDPSLATPSSGVDGTTTNGTVTSEGDNVSSKKSSNLGAIVGGVVGGIGAIMAAILAFLLLMRRRRSSEGESMAFSQYPQPNPLLDTQLSPIQPSRSSRASGLYPVRFGHSSVALTADASTTSFSDEKAPLRENQDLANIQLSRQQALQRQLEAVQSEMQALHNEFQNSHGHQPNDWNEDPSPDMRRMRQQMAVMEEQMRNLRMQFDSAWARGLTDDPPPGYSPV